MLGKYLNEKKFKIAIKKLHEKYLDKLPITKNKIVFEQYHYKQIRPNKRDPWDGFKAKEYIDSMEKIYQKRSLNIVKILRPTTTINSIPLDLNIEELHKGRINRKNFQLIKKTNKFKTWRETQYIVQNGICYYCVKSIKGYYEIDHKVPLARGGSNNFNNLVLACKECNQAKSYSANYERFNEQGDIENSKKYSGLLALGLEVNNIEIVEKKLIQLYDLRTLRKMYLKYNKMRRNNVMKYLIKNNIIAIPIKPINSKSNGIQKWEVKYLLENKIKIIEIEL